MTQLFKGFLFSVTLLISFSACSSSEKTTAESNSIYPAWYSQAGFNSDSLGFHGYATAVSYDSVIAIANAEMMARVNLETGIAVKLEAVRESLVENGSEEASGNDFIITLRNSHSAVESVANERKGEARVIEGYYSGFSKVSITKEELKKLIESGFSEKASYWKTLSSSSVFLEEFE